MRDEICYASLLSVWAPIIKPGTPTTKPAHGSSLNNLATVEFRSLVATVECGVAIIPALSETAIPVLAFPQSKAIYRAMSAR